MKCVINNEVVLSQSPDGPVAAHIGAFARSQSTQGYTRSSIHRQVLLAAGFSHWLKQEGVTLPHVDCGHTSLYLRDRARRVRPCRGDAAALKHLLDFLRREGVIVAEKIVPHRLTPAEWCTHEYGQHLRDACALARATIVNYVPFIRGFLTDRFGDGPVRLTPERRRCRAICPAPSPTVASETREAPDKVNVGEWLAERVAAIQHHDPFERLLNELLTADEWLSDVSAPNNRHTFSVGAFVGSEPVFALVSNFETPSGPSAATANARLTVSELRPAEPRTFVAGQAQAVSPAQRQRLAALAAENPDPQQMHAAMAEVNRSVAAQNNRVSRACFTTHLNLTGQSSGIVHDLGNRPFLPSFAIPAPALDMVTRLLDKQFGPGRAQLRQMASVRSESTDEYHETQLREKPDDASVHSNYGAFLKGTKGDAQGAEREYRSLELDSKHVNALANLANLMWEKGDRDQAETLYRRALETDPQNEHVTYNFARFLHQESGDRTAALTVLSTGIKGNPHSGRLLLLQGELSLLEGNTAQALESFRHARDKQADQAQTESGIAR